MKSLAALCTLAALLFTQSTPSTDAERADRLRRMRELASSFRLLSDAAKPDSAVPLIETPLLRYNDETRESHDSSLWIWSTGGRPTALLAIELYPEKPRGPRWLFEIASLSTGRIGARHATDLDWTARRRWREWTG